MTPDPRWLEILKASGWQTAALAAAAGLVLWANHARLIPELGPWTFQFAAAAMLVCGLLAVASFFSNALEKLSAWGARFKEWCGLKAAIETLNAEETEFLKHQVEINQATIQLHPFNAGGIPNFVHKAGMYRGLAEKKIVDVIFADPQGKIQTITIKQNAMKMLKKKFKR